MKKEIELKGLGVVLFSLAIFLFSITSVFADIVFSPVDYLLFGPVGWVVTIIVIALIVIFLMRALKKIRKKSLKSRKNT